MLNPAILCSWTDEADQWKWLSGLKTRMYSFRKDRRLSSPLNGGEIDYIRRHSEEPDCLKREHKALLRDYRDCTLSYKYENFVSDFTNAVEHTSLNTEKSNSGLMFAVNAGVQAHNISVTSWMRYTPSYYLPHLCPQDLITPEIRSWHAWKEYFSEQDGDCR